MKVWVGCARGVQVAYVTLHHRGCTLVLPSTYAKRVPNFEAATEGPDMLGDRRDRKDMLQKGDRG